MRRFKSVIIDNDHDLIKFNEKASKFIGVDFPLSYYKQGIVRAFMDKTGELVGGYALIRQGPFRTIQSLPINAFENSKEEDHFDCL